MDITYRVVTDTNNLEQVVDLEILIWGLDPRDAVPTHMLHTLALNGGMLGVAEINSQIVGMCLGFAAREARSWYLWSNMAGVHPDYQGRGIGHHLKQLQREWALDNGFREIRWTFDPLQRGNANFNINKLGATASHYHVNYYGEMNDEINVGLPSDRLEVCWNIKRKTRKQTKKRHVPIDESAVWLKQDTENRPRQREHDFSLTSGYVEIPPDIGQIKHISPELALEWRLALRETLETAFEKGFTIIDFISIDAHSYYYLIAPQPWFMYVVECADHSLYTGITPNVEQRIKKHNSGKGAAYTASRRPVRLIATWHYMNRSAALKAEAAFKKQSRQTKLTQVNAHGEYAGGAFVKFDNS